MPELQTAGDIGAIIDSDRFPMFRDGSPTLTRATMVEIRAQLLNNLAFNAAFLTWFASLPTSLPSTPGVAWNNGRTLAVS